MRESAFCVSDGAVVTTGGCSLDCEVCVDVGTAVCSGIPQKVRNCLPSRPTTSRPERGKGLDTRRFYGGDFFILEVVPKGDFSIG